METKDTRKRSIAITLPLMVRITLIAANIFVIFGIFFAALEYREIKDNNKRLLAIDAVNRFYNTDFFKSTAVYHSETDKSSNKYIDASNNLFSTYYYIAIVYEKNIADNEIISEAIKYELQRYVKDTSFLNREHKAIRDKILEMNKSINSIKQ